MRVVTQAEHVHDKNICSLFQRLEEGSVVEAANANLIAAAPALLEALESLLPFADRDIGELASLRDPDWEEAAATLDRSIAIIAHAKGE